MIDGLRVPTNLNLHRIYNGLEQLMETKDANNGYTRYAYDGAGNPIALKDANGNQIDTSFNALGHKQYVDDPNMGRKDFTYNVLSELQSETDANGDTLAYTYDKLARMTLRKVNGVNHGAWVYDNTAANKGLGLLDYEDSHVQSDGSRLIKSFTYTPVSSGRKLPVTVQHRIYENTTAFSNYTVQTDYDSTYSRPSKLTYPNGLEVGFEYNLHGFLTKELDAQTNEVYRQVTAMDARDLITRSHLANSNLLETVDYAAQTGQMRGIEVKKGSELRHSLDYLYDGFGNLHFRETQHGIDRAEERFEYDVLHRVTKSTRSYNPAVVIGNNPDEVVNYAFDKVGNLMLKSDYASNYDYTGAKPNAVKQVTLADGGGAVNFGYDSNGNMTAGHNKTMAYNVFNKPTRIVSGNSTSDFQYGANIMRYKKEETGTNSRTTIYIDKLMEIVTEGNTVKRKAYVGSTAVVTETEESGSMARATHYLLKGRLGSTITVTDGSGDVVEANGFDPFGKPRTGLWQNKASNQLESQVTTRGYTGHEHLDESQLIHMNGRAYDYNLGRFLSVDPVIQSPTNSQSMNPYSYIMNNPLAGVDPTGYKAEIEQERFKFDKVKVTGSNISQTKVTDTVTGESKVTSLSVSGAKSFLAQNGGAQSQGASSIGSNISGGENSVSGIDQTESAPVSNQSSQNERVTFRSPEILRSTVPGQVNYDNGMESFYNDEALKGVGFMAAALTEQVLTVLTLGTGHAANSSSKVAISTTRTSTVSSSQATKEGLNTLRTSYLQQVDDLAAAANSMRAAGLNADDALKILVPLRNELKLEVRRQGPWWAARAADVRNIFKYGNRAGPTADNLIKRYGNAENALEALQRTSSAVNRATGAGK